MARRPVIAVIGDAALAAGDPREPFAEAVGRLLRIRAGIFKQGDWVASWRRRVGVPGCPLVGHPVPLLAFCRAGSLLLPIPMWMWLCRQEWAMGETSWSPKRMLSWPLAVGRARCQKWPWHGCYADWWSLVGEMVGSVGGSTHRSMDRHPSQ